MDAKGGGSSPQIDVHILSGPDYGTRRSLARSVTTDWQTYRWDLSSWAGQSIRIYLEKQYGAWVDYDNLATEDVFPN